MANLRKQNVWVIDTTGAITLPGTIHSVKLCSGADASTAVILADDINGKQCYQVQAGAAADTYEPNLDIQLNRGFYVTLTGTSPKLYLYME
jgi:hypothetical protein